MRPFTIPIKQAPEHRPPSLARAGRRSTCGALAARQRRDPATGLRPRSRGPRALHHPPAYAIFFAVVFVGSSSPCARRRARSLGAAPEAAPGDARGSAGGLLGPLFLLVAQLRLLRAVELALPAAHLRLVHRRLLPRPRHRRASERPAPGAAMLVVTVALNLGFLGFFKYWNFALENARVLAALLGAARPRPRRRGAQGAAAAGRHLVLHVRVDELRHRRLPRRARAAPELPPLPALRRVLPAPRRRPDRAPARSPAAARAARRRSTRDDGRRGALPDRGRA